MPKIVINDSETGKSHQSELDPSKMGALMGTRLGEEVDGGFIGLSGYTLKLRGGTDKQGFPMRRGIHRTGRISLLLRGGPGYPRAKGGTRKRKSVAGELVDENIEQLNFSITERGKTSLEEALKKEGE